MTEKSHFVRWISEINNDDSGVVGLKAASLGELTYQKLPVPKTFVILPHVFSHYLKETKLDVKIKHILSSTNFNHLDSLHKSSSHIKKMILESSLPDDTVKAIRSYYKELGEKTVCIKFSHVVDPMSKQSFTQSPDTIFNIKGDAVLIEKVKAAFASIYNPKELFYRHNHQISQNNIEFSLIVQEVLKSSSCGIINTIDLKTNNKSQIVINAFYGEYNLSEDEADVYYLKKNDLSIINKIISFQETEIRNDGSEFKEFKVDSKQLNKQKISDTQIKELAKYAVEIEKYYYFTQQVQWLLSDNKIFIIQTIPATHVTNPKIQSKDASILISALPGNEGISSGLIKIIKSADDTNSITSDDILVLKEIKSNYLNFINKASAVIFEISDKNIKILFNSGKLNIPSIYGATNASKILKDGDIVTVNGKKGEVYKGGFNTSHSTNTEHILQTSATKLFVETTDNFLPMDINKSISDGIGCITSKKILKNVGIHPEILIKEKRENDFVLPLAKYISQFCNEISPKPVIFQTLNLTTRDFLKLEGGSSVENLDDNPSLGFRGAFRYIHNPQSFNLELNAIEKVRNEFGFKNLWLMIPYVRTPEELILVKKLINKSGLERSESFKLFMSIDIPLNAFQIEEFIKIGLDGISINYESFTNLLIGTDTSNFEIIAETSKYNEYIFTILKQILDISNKYSVFSSIYNISTLNLDLAKDVVSLGINSICVHPDELINARKTLIHIEKQFINK